MQIERELRQMIRQPELQNGGLFPDELTLANRFGVSRGTVRGQLGCLVNERLLRRRRGSVTRVRPPRAESCIAGWRSFSQEMARRNVTVENFHQAVRVVAAFFS